MPKISLFIPIYNEENILKKTVDEIFNKLNYDFELFIVDDNSNDSTQHVGKELARKYKISDWVVGLYE